MPRCLAAVLLWLMLLAPVAALAEAGFDEPLEPPGLAASAALYRTRLLAKGPPQPAPRAIEAARAAAERDEAAQRVEAAIGELERAVNQGGDDAALWLDLSRLWLAAPRPDPARAAQTAWTAYQNATADADRDAALLALADILDRRLGRPGDALALLRRMQANGWSADGLKARIAALAARVGLEWRRVKVDAESDQPRICLAFTAPLRQAPTIRYEDYVTAEPALPLVAEAAGNELCLSGFAHASHYRITLREGLPGADGLTLRHAETREVAIGDRQPAVAFRGNGFILPRLGPQGVPVTTVNLDAVNLKVYRIGDRNLTAEVARQFPRGLDRWTAEQIATQQGERLWQGRLAVKDERNAPVVTAIPVPQLLGPLRAGLYAITAAPADLPESEAPYIRATQWLVVSDLARNNAELARTRSGADGASHVDRGVTQGKGGNEPALVLAYGPEGDFAFLDFGRPALDLSDRGVAGHQPPGPLDAFLYTDRGVYRPGERINLAALLRDDQGGTVAGVPLTLKVLRPNGTVLRSGVAPAAMPDPDQLRLVFPEPASTLDLAARDGTLASLTLLAAGGRRPLSWLVDGRPLPPTAGREALFTPTHPGPLRITVLDSQGRSAAAELTLR